MFAHLLNNFSICHSYEFRLRVALVLGGDLLLTSRIRNTNSDGKSFSFTIAFHTYVSLSDIRSVVHLPFVRTQQSFEVIPVWFDGSVKSGLKVWRHGTTSTTWRKGSVSLNKETHSHSSLRWGELESLSTLWYLLISNSSIATFFFIRAVTRSIESTWARPLRLQS